MKYGILTLHETLNYGSALQTYGLYYGMKKLGLDVEVVNYRCEKIYQNEFYPFRNRSILRKAVLSILYGGKYRKKKDRFNEFFDNIVHLSRKLYERNTITESMKDYDAYVIGSDMVWNLEITGNDLTYFLDFVKDRKKKYAFSASAGDYTMLKGKSEILALIDDFTFIAMRECASALFLEKELNREVKHLQDPTILLDELVLNKLARKPMYDKYVLIYYRDLDGKIFNDAKRYAAEKGLKLLYINIGKKQDGIDNVFVPGVEEFLGYIKYADAVFTSSYHGMLFSIYYNKKFWYYTNNQSSRMDSVVETYGIEGRNGSKGFLIDSSVDYEIIDEHIKKYRQEYVEELINCFMN